MFFDYARILISNFKNKKNEKNFNFDNCNV